MKQRLLPAPDRRVLLVGLVAVAAAGARDWWRGRHSHPSAPDVPSIAPIASWPSRPKVSVLVAAWNEADNIDDHIRSFLALGYPNAELVLCAGGDDDTSARATQRAADARVKVFAQRPGEGKQAALRRVLSAADGEVIMLTDADCEFTDEAFLRLVAPIAAGEAVVTTGGSEPKPAQRGNPLVQSATMQWPRRNRCPRRETP